MKPAVPKLDPSDPQEMRLLIKAVRTCLHAAIRGLRDGEVALPLNTLEELQKEFES